MNASGFTVWSLLRIQFLKRMKRASHSSAEIEGGPPSSLMRPSPARLDPRSLWEPRRRKARFRRLFFGDQATPRNARRLPGRYSPTAFAVGSDATPMSSDHLVRLPQKEQVFPAATIQEIDSLSG